MKNNSQIIATCDRQGNINGQIERWEAHKKGILHRAFTVAMLYKNKYIIQHRKHPVFDNTFDVTSSSHQLVKNGKIENTIDAAINCIFREWKISRSDLGKIKNEGAFYYKAKDKKSVYIEHEYCDLVTVDIKSMPEPNFEVAYGYSLMTRQEIKNRDSRTYHLLTPWTQKMLQKNLL